MILFYFSGCFNDGMMTAVHEMMHTLGFVHEHTRPDRRVFIYALHFFIIALAVSRPYKFASLISGIPLSKSTLKTLRLGWRQTSKRENKALVTLL